MQARRHVSTRPTRIVDPSRWPAEGRLQLAARSTATPGRIIHGRIGSIAVYAAQERERRRIAGGLHDDVGPVLAAALLRLESLRRLQRCEPDVASAVVEVSELLHYVVERVRSLTFDLGSPALYELGLVTGVETLCARVERESGLRVELVSDPDCETIRDPARIELYRSLRELLHNVEKHANARAARVEVRRDEREARVAVEDDGVGLVRSNAGRDRDPDGGFGLSGMTERLRTLGGRLELGPCPGGGTRAVAIVPIDCAITLGGPGP